MECRVANVPQNVLGHPGTVGHGDPCLGGSLVNRDAIVHCATLRRRMVDCGRAQRAQQGGLGVKVAALNPVPVHPRRLGPAASIAA
jgi:hypothetical protein